MRPKSKSYTEGEKKKRIRPCYKMINIKYYIISYSLFYFYERENIL